VSKQNIVVSLFDLTGEMVKPWVEAGYTAYILDNQHPSAYSTNGVTQLEDRLYAVHFDLSRPWMPPFDRDQIAFVAAFPPCDHLAVSGARWFKGKGLRKLSEAVNLFATAVEWCEWAGAPYMIENPVSSISSHWRKADYSFHPWHFTKLEPTDNYTKKTCLWTGNGFVMPEMQADDSLGDPDDRIHKAPPSAERANLRSQTPRGFARAVFKANHRLEAAA
jgi:hypothetical protein